jgi:hypothetical protein
MDRAETYYRYVLKHTGKDLFTKHLNGAITLDQYVARISQQTGGIKYRVLDDVIKKMGAEVLESNPIVEKMVSDMAKTSHQGGDILSNLDLFKIQKKCFESINRQPRSALKRQAFNSIKAKKMQNQ